MPVPLKLTGEGHFACCCSQADLEREAVAEAHAADVEWRAAKAKAAEAFTGDALASAMAAAEVR